MKWSLVFELVTARIRVYPDPLQSFSLSLSDVVSIERTGDHFRLLYDVKGRYILHKITAEEAKVCVPVVAADAGGTWHRHC